LNSDEKERRLNLADFEEWSYIKAVAVSEGWVHKKDSEHRKGEVNLQETQAAIGVEYRRLRMLQATFENTTKELQKAVREGKIKLATHSLFRHWIKMNKRN